jgi:hypothetical protein
LHLNLPPGYHAHLDPEFLVLRRTDGSMVARFSGRGLVAEEVERAAWEDYSDAGGGSPQAQPLACGVTLSLRVLALFLGRLARPDEGFRDGSTQLAPFSIGLCTDRGVRGAL